MNEKQINQCGDELFEAMMKRQTLAPFTQRFTEISIADAYNISQRMIERRLAAGEKIVGKKIGATSQAVQQMLNISQPDFGFLTDSMAYGDAQEIPISELLIQPKAEGEIAFILKKDIIGPGVTNADVLAATDYVVPCFEVVDSRIENWNIKIEDTVADNASCGLFVLGNAAVSPDNFDFVNCEMTVEKNGVLISTGKGSAALGNPVNCVTWLANTLGEFGIGLKAGDVILSGSLVPLEPIQAGDQMRVSISGIGSASVRFV
jgi:2-oxopent-4-enoate/cis-2-oxohex-4-enoate hydratase